MRTLAGLAIAMATAFPLGAVDGVVLISQNGALAGNVTPGDAPGFPVTISAAGSYRLSSNLTVPDANTTAIQITADNVTLDLNGFAIVGPTVCSGQPVTSCSPFGFGSGVSSLKSNIVVFSGTIRGMGFQGIALSGGQERVERVIAYNNGGTGIKALSGSVVSCTAKSNAGHGIEVNGIATGNTTEANAQVGINMGVGVAVNNTANSNGGAGVNGGEFVAVANFAVSNQSSDIFAGCPSVVVSNKAGAGVVTGGAGCTLANNSQ